MQIAPLRIQGRGTHAPADQIAYHSTQIHLIHLAAEKRRPLDDGPITAIGNDFSDDELRRIIDIAKAITQIANSRT